MERWRNSDVKGEIQLGLRLLQLAIIHAKAKMPPTRPARSERESGTATRSPPLLPLAGAESAPIVATGPRPSEPTPKPDLAPLAAVLSEAVEVAVVVDEDW